MFRNQEIIKMILSMLYSLAVHYVVRGYESFSSFLKKKFRVYHFDKC